MSCDHSQIHVVFRENANKNKKGKEQYGQERSCLTNSLPVLDPIQDDLGIARRAVGSRTKYICIL